MLSPLACVASPLPSPSPSEATSEVVDGRPFNVAPCPVVGKLPLALCGRQLHASTDSTGVAHAAHEALFAASARPAWRRSFTVESADGIVSRSCGSLPAQRGPRLARDGSRALEIGPVLIDLSLTFDGPLFPGLSERG